MKIAENVKFSQFVFHWSVQKAALMLPVCSSLMKLLTAC